MATPWTNTYAIMRDLSTAQGFLPVDVNGTLAAGDKPPVPVIVEETEEEFYRSGTVDTDFAPPDIGAIKSMLDLVRGLDVTSDAEEVDVMDKGQISKLHPKRKECLPENLKIGDAVPISFEKTPKEIDKNRSLVKKVKKRQRNIAVESLLKAIEDNSPKLAFKEKLNNLKLLKPIDFKLTETEEKVNVWFDKHEKQKQETKRNILSLNPVSMFRKKEAAIEAPKPVVKAETSAPQTQSYVPSTHANEYYKTYLARSHMRQLVQEDIWTKAEQEMKEIDAKRKQRAELSEAESSALTSPTSQLTTISTASEVETGDQKWDAVRLPMHRHQLTRYCVVCDVVTGREPRTRRVETSRQPLGLDGSGAESDTKS